MVCFGGWGVPVLQNKANRRSSPPERKRFYLKEVLALLFILHPLQALLALPLRLKGLVDSYLILHL